MSNTSASRQAPIISKPSAADIPIGLSERTCSPVISSMRPPLLAIVRDLTQFDPCAAGDRAVDRPFQPQRRNPVGDRGARRAAVADPLDEVAQLADESVDLETVLVVGRPDV